MLATFALSCFSNLGTLCAIANPCLSNIFCIEYVDRFNDSVYIAPMLTAEWLKCWLYRQPNKTTNNRKNQKMNIKAVRNKKTNERALVVDGGLIPFGIASMCCDKRISGFEVKCTECRETYPVRELNEGGYCETCVFADFAE